MKRLVRRASDNFVVKGIEYEDFDMGPFYRTFPMFLVEQKNNIFTQEEFDSDAIAPEDMETKPRYKELFSVIENYFKNHINDEQMQNAMITWLRGDDLSEGVAREYDEDRREEIMEDFEDVESKKMSAKQFFTKYPDALENCIQYGFYNAGYSNCWGIKLV